jgi:peptidoglycan hydrolase-like protein with peptidoglycan-binding domain
MKKVLLMTGVAVLALATIVGAAGYTFSTNLTVGSTGADVVALQTALIGAGYNIPAIASGAAAKGYFGSQTQAAVKLFQAARGVPNTGFVGPLTRGVLNGGTVATSVTTGCPVGYDCFLKGTTVPVTTNPGVITTIGAEGLITTKLASNPIADANIHVASNVSVYGIEIKAQGSDMVVDRVLLQMAVGVGSATGSLSNPATFVRTLYAYDGSTLLKSWTLGASDFNKDSSDRYYVIASGMRFIVPKDTTKVLTFSVDVVGVSSDQSSRYLTVQGYAGNTQNVRATDGAGLNSYADMSGTSNSRVQVFTTSGSSTLTATTNASLTPKSTTNRITSDGLKGVTMQVIDVKSETGDSFIKTMYVKASATSTSGLPSTLYLYDGSQVLASVSGPTGGPAEVAFTDLNVRVTKDTTKQLTIKADFASTVSGQAASTSLVANSIKWEKPDSTTASTTPAGTIAGNDQYLYSAAPKWELVSANIASVAGVKDVSSSSVTGTIVLKATAMGGSMTKPVAGDFSVGFSSTSATTFTSWKNYLPAGSDTSSTTKSVTISPTDSSVGDGGTYTITIVGTLNSTSVSIPGSGGQYYMVVKDIDSVVGSVTITDQTWGIDTFLTTSALLPKGTY